MNLDGFKKISTIEHGGLHSKDDMEFQNPYFVRDDAGLMAHIKRKVMVMAWDIKFKVNHLVNDVCSVLRFTRSKSMERVHSMLLFFSTYAVFQWPSAIKSSKPHMYIHIRIYRACSFDS